jgi:MerR family transcriptional regulator, redox-sensitive transcriptional activator SoxR
MATAAPAMTIGEVARRSGTPVTTLRFYERRGLLEPPARVGGQRRYGGEVLMRLMVIRFCRVAGLSLDDVAVVVADETPEREATRQIARHHIEVIDRQLAQLAMARRMMEAALRCSCPSVDACTCGAMAPVARELRDHLAAGGGP